MRIDGTEKRAHLDQGGKHCTTRQCQRNAYSNRERANLATRCNVSSATDSSEGKGI